MKFLHLSDLHIGKSVNGFSMLEEQRHVFRQIIGYIQTEHPDAAVIAGDIYDRAVPGIEAVRVFDDFITELVNEEITIMIIAGNHDSPERLSYASRLLADKKLFISGAFDGNIRKVVLSDNFGDVTFWLLPFIKPFSVRGLFNEREIETYDDALAAVIETAVVDYSARNVLVSHQFYTKSGVLPIRSESEINPIGGLDAININIAEKFDYVALGHLHGSQRIGADHIRYAGSPLKYSFSEIRQEKSVTLVELNKKGNFLVSDLPLTPLHDMREIKGELEKLVNDEKSALADKEDYLRVILTDEEEIIDPMGKIRSVYPNVMALDFENPRTNSDVSAINLDSERISALSSYELFSEFFLEMRGFVMSEEQEALIKELLETGCRNEAP
ncbi:MAG: exonuclease SbcCD subunit D [Clostridiales bacterium]|jgi:exonuclease SbcD|nr:exonuclease SbcCD subunit D [Clostridiales bacterium]